MKKNNHKKEYKKTIKNFTTEFLIIEKENLEKQLDELFTNFKLTGDVNFLKGDMCILCLEKRLCEKEIERRIYQYDKKHYFSKKPIDFSKLKKINKN